MAGVRQNFRTGENELLKLASQKVDRKSGELVNAHKCYFEVGSKLYKIEITNANKEGKNGGSALWVKITEKKKQSGGGYGSNGNGYKKGF